jgi:hypothetical protein
VGGPELIAAMPRKAIIQGFADDRMPKGVAVIPFFEETHLQGAI